MRQYKPRYEEKLTAGSLRAIRRMFAETRDSFDECSPKLASLSTNVRRKHRFYTESFCNIIYYTGSPEIQ